MSDKLNELKSRVEELQKTRTDSEITMHRIDGALFEANKNLNEAMKAAADAAAKAKKDSK